MKLSIIIPIYNASKSILRLLTPALNLTNNDFEIICVNDGSTDNSLEILSKINDSRLSVFSKENEGTFKTWQYGFLKSKGEYVTFFDQDDYIEDEYIPYILNFIDTIHADVLQTPYTTEKISGEKTITKLPLQTGLYTKEKLEKARVYLTTGRFQYAKFTKVIRRDILQKQVNNTLENPVRDCVRDFEDWLTMIEIYKTIDSLYIDNRNFYHYIQYPNSVSKSSKSYKSNYESFLAMMTYLETSDYSKLSAEELTSIGFFGSRVILNKCTKIKEKELMAKVLKSDYYIRGLGGLGIGAIEKIIAKTQNTELYYICYKIRSFLKKG